MADNSQDDANKGGDMETWEESPMSSETEQRYEEYRRVVPEQRKHEAREREKELTESIEKSQIEFTNNVLSRPLPGAGKSDYTKATVNPSISISHRSSCEEGNDSELISKDADELVAETNATKDFSKSPNEDGSLQTTSCPSEGIPMDDDFVNSLLNIPKEKITQHAEAGNKKDTGVKTKLRNEQDSIEQNEVKVFTSSSSDSSNLSGKRIKSADELIAEGLIASNQDFFDYDISDSELQYETEFLEQNNLASTIPDQAFDIPEINKNEPIDDPDMPSMKTPICEVSDEKIERELDMIVRSSPRRVPTKLREDGSLQKDKYLLPQDLPTPSICSPRNENDLYDNAFGNISPILLTTQAESTAHQKKFPECICTRPCIPEEGIHGGARICPSHKQYFNKIVEDGCHCKKDISLLYDSSDGTTAITTETIEKMELPSDNSTSSKENDNADGKCLEPNVDENTKSIIRKSMELVSVMSVDENSTLSEAMIKPNPDAELIHFEQNELNSLESLMSNLTIEEHDPSKEICSTCKLSINSCLCGAALEE